MLPPPIINQSHLSKFSKLIFVSNVFVEVIFWGWVNILKFSKLNFVSNVLYFSNQLNYHSFIYHHQIIFKTTPFAIISIINIIMIIKIPNIIFHPKTLQLKSALLSCSRRAARHLHRQNRQHCHPCHPQNRQNCKNCKNHDQHDDNCQTASPSNYGEMQRRWRRGCLQQRWSWFGVFTHRDLVFSLINNLISSLIVTHRHWWGDEWKYE